MLKKLMDGKTLLLATRNIQAAGLMVGGSGRLGIMDDGILVAIAQKRRLLSMYGSGCHLTVRLNKKSPVSGRGIEDVKSALSDLFLDNAPDLSAANNTKIADETNCQIVYRLPSDYIRTELEEFMRFRANDLGIASWELNALGLTDVYYRLLA